MSVTLINDKKSMWIANSTAWSSALLLAVEYDWVEAGTSDPLQPGSDIGWKGNYSLNNGQKVGATDARAFANALEAALADTPDSPDEGWLLSGDFRTHIVRLIGFCREGSFRVF
jgi:hypothetical protein